MKRGLTEQQERLLSYIRNYMAESPVAPSYDEMKEFLGLSSKSGVHRLVKALRDRGYIRSAKNRARAIVLLEGEEVFMIDALKKVLSDNDLTADTRAELLGKLDALTQRSLHCNIS